MNVNEIDVEQYDAKELRWDKVTDAAHWLYNVAIHNQRELGVPIFYNQTNYRVVPKDPLLKAMVLAKVENGKNA